MEVIRETVSFLSISAEGDKNERIDELAKAVYKILDKLENRISTLEKVLASHAKCIGEMREEKNE